MKKYWITTHWPHRRSTRSDAPHSGVWVADDKRNVIAPMNIGDLVWIYESQTGRSIVKEKANGDKQTIRHHNGRGGIVTLVEVIEEAEEDPDSEIETYIDGTRIWWRWYTATRILNSAGFVPRKLLNKILGYKSNYSLRGFGTRKSGLMEISPDIHGKIKDVFLHFHKEKDELRLKRRKSNQWGGKGGEGPIHKALKESIAADPDTILGEANLELIKVEYPFGDTGDRIDVLLRDNIGRYLAIEVEPECPPGHMAGPLQCMKYRALLAYKLNREVEEIRTCLVAHDIATDVRNQAEKYGIECINVPERSN